MLPAAPASLFLGVAIVAEVFATSALKASDGFTRPLPALLSLGGYAFAFVLLSGALRTIPTGIAYAIWSGIGIVLISLVAWLRDGQALDLPALSGMALIIAGVGVIQLFSRTAPP
ncbi:MAG: QacE family quaternary ammonium compound efflux SMR transporter [Gluconacetobacter diazotrophicus]|nr:QacE family quaternary ammonium compound efflux SMR transporter [Gluconacetobacter diazotrophicus]